MGEKTEPATQKKLRDARKKGQVAKAQDFPAALTFVASVAMTLAMARQLYLLLGNFMIGMFTEATHVDYNSAVGGLMNQCMMIIMRASMPVLILVSGIGALVTFMVVGPVFSVESMKPDMKRFNVVENLKQKFKLKTWVEIIKSVAKITVASYLIYQVMWSSLDQIVATAAMDVLAQGDIIYDFLIKSMIRVGIFFLAVAVFDLVFQKRTFAKEMKMEKFEVKQEYKDSEGDPEVKGRRRQMAREIAYDEGPKAARKAKVVISNPTHLAVAVAFDQEKDPAPYVACKGSHGTALAIIKIAEDNGIPVMRNVPLAHMLFSKVEANDYIPGETYEAMAEVLIWVQKIEQEKKLQEGM